MFVKICGTTNLPDAELSVALGADALGFIFAPSRRRITVEHAASIARRLPPHVLRVGVFTEPQLDEVAAVVRTTGMTAVQMHWPFQPALVQELRAKLGDGVLLWQVVTVPVQATHEDAHLERCAQTLRTVLRDPRLDVVLLDAERDGASGGRGEPFEWNRAAALLKQIYAEAEQKPDRANPPRLVVAGGLDASNVAEAVAALRPWGVDVVSGVEAAPGSKSPDKLRAFLSAAREAGRSSPR